MIMAASYDHLVEADSGRAGMDDDVVRVEDGDFSDG